MSENNKYSESNLSGKIRACLIIYLLLAFLYILFISLSGVDYQNSTTGFYFVAFTIFFIIFFSVIYYAFEFVAFLLGRYRKNVPWYSKKRNILLVLLMVCTPLNLAGFCYSQFKFYSDEELIRIGVNEAMKSYHQQIKRWGENIDKSSYQLRKLPRNTKFIKYASAEEFIKNNPNCCAIKRFYRRGLFSGGSYLSALLFNYHVRVRVNGLIRDKNFKSGPKFFSMNHYIDCCGSVSEYSGPSFSE